MIATLETFVAGLAPAFFLLTVLALAWALNRIDQEKP